MSRNFGFPGLLDRTLGVGGIVVGPILRPMRCDGHLNSSQIYLSDGLEDKTDLEVFGSMGIATVNPATGEVVKTFTALSDAEVEAKVQRAAETFLSYRKVPFADRARLMTKAAEILEKEKEVFGRLMTLEMGKPLRAAIAEAAKCATACRYYAENAERFLADEIVDTSAKKSFVRYLPIGPVLAVMPWNFPFWQVIRFAAPALMAGNVGLLKHASNVPQCALKIEELFCRAGFPQGAFQTLLIGSQRVDDLLNDPRIVAATLTGSEQAGIQVGMGAAKRIKKVVLELGGSDPFIVMPSADLDAAVSTAVTARMINNGQSCIAAKRFIVHEQIYDEFLSRFVSGVSSVRIGNPMDETTEPAPLATGAIRDELDAQVRKSVAAGARVLTGGQKIDRQGFFSPPTVLADIPPTAPAARDELFGPVASVFRARDIGDAIAIANGTDFGLGASAWTRDDAERDRFVAEIQSGLLFINGMVASDSRLPFGGVKHSGFGRELGEFGIREFVNIKSVRVIREHRTKTSATE